MQGSMSLLVSDLLDLQQTEHAQIFEGCQYPWEAISGIADYLQKNLKPAIHGKVSPHAVIEGAVYIGEETIVEPHVYIKGPVWIGSKCEIRQGAYLRGNVIAGNDCVLGNSCEFKNVMLFNQVQAPHFAYLGDSILGHKAHLASGVTLSNLKMTQGNVKVIVQGQEVDSRLRKFGAIIGDFAEVGCNGVLNPGSVIGRSSILYPGISWRGICPANTLVKLKQEHTLVTRKRV